MMKNNDEVLERYYRGETTVDEERLLRRLFEGGELPDEPVLAFRQRSRELPAGLEAKIRGEIHRRRSLRMQHWSLIVGGVAASLILILSLRSFLPQPAYLQLSDNIKKERFENALRTIGNVLEEKTPPVQKVIYEDNKLIISIE